MNARDIDASFSEDTAEHVLTVLRDDGLYRHLRCRKPGTGIFGFDIITWPGYLAYVGDMGDYVFTRQDDMLGFFGSDGINPSYWSEKCVAVDHSDGIREFSVDEYKEQVQEWRDETAYEMDGDGDACVDFVDAVNEELLDSFYDPTEEQAHRALSEFRHGDIECSGSWEWDLRRFSWRYIWFCRAIVWAVREYEKATAKHTECGL